jgi:hypothetical protein
MEHIFEGGLHMTMANLTPAQAWDGFVGSQTPQEFVEVSRQKGLLTVDDAVYAYVMDIPTMFQQEYTTPELLGVNRLLCAYIREQGIN